MLDTLDRPWRWQLQRLALIILLLAPACSSSSTGARTDRDLGTNGKDQDSGIGNGAACGSAGSIIVAALQNERDDGQNAALAGGGLYINWVYSPTPPPTLVNLNTNGVPDQNPTTRHDRLTDIEFLAALALYKSICPSDTQFDEVLAKFTGIVTKEFTPTSPDERGWLQWLYQETAPSVPALASYPDAAADAYYRQYQAQYQRFQQALPLKVDKITPAATNPPNADDTYRCDITLEQGAVLVHNGAKRGMMEYVAAGQSLIDFVQRNCYDPVHHVWASQMGQVFVKGSNQTMLSPPGQQVIVRGSIIIAGGTTEKLNGGDFKMGQLAELAEALCISERAAPGHGYGAIAQAVLDDVVPGGANTLGLWDTAHGGYFQGVLIAGDSIQAPTGITTSNTYKEVGRAASMTRTLIACNCALANRYAAALAPVQKAVTDSYYQDGHGWPYQEKPDYSLYGASPGNWVTSESTGHAARALLNQLAPVCD